MAFDCIKFNTGTYGVISCGSGSSTDLLFDSGGTIAFWMRPALYSTGDYSLSKVRWYCGMTTDDITFVVDYTTQDGKWEIVGPAVNTWAHVAFSYTNGDIANNPTGYLNGSPVTTTETLTPSGTRVSDAADTLYVGNYSTGAYQFNGCLADVRLFASILSDANISTLYNGGTPLMTALGGEKFWLKCNETSSGFHDYPLLSTNTLYDASGNGNTGTPSGGPQGWAGTAPRMPMWWTRSVDALDRPVPIKILVPLRRPDQTNSFYRSRNPSAYY